MYTFLYIYTSVCIYLGDRWMIILLQPHCKKSLSKGEFTTMTCHFSLVTSSNITRDIWWKLYQRSNSCHPSSRRSWFSRKSDDCSDTAQLFSQSFLNNNHPMCTYVSAQFDLQLFFFFVSKKKGIDMGTYTMSSFSKTQQVPFVSFECLKRCSFFSPTLLRLHFCGGFRWLWGGYPSIPMIVFGQHELDISSLFKTFRVENYMEPMIFKVESGCAGGFPWYHLCFC